VTKNEDQPRASNRCGARTRQGTRCKNRPVTGRKRCRMHGGARGSGAPKGNQNALKHGHYTQAASLERLKIRMILRLLRSTCDEIYCE